MIIVQCCFLLLFVKLLNAGFVNRSTIPMEEGERVIGGEKVLNVVPYQVSIQSSSRYQWKHICGGAIITPKHILTAAHCVNKFSVEDLSIVAGTLNWRSGGLRYRVVDKRVHPSFSPSTFVTNDIAIVKVQPALNMRKRQVETISLGNGKYVTNKIAVRLTGWGLMTPSGHSERLAGHLQSLQKFTITNSACAQSGFLVTRNELCTLAIKGQGACLGDSGGPLVTLTPPQQLVGIVSYGSAKCGQGKPDVYTRVSTFLSYINRVITIEMP